jgi:hypothetical protein
VRARSWVRHYSFYPAVNTGYAAYSTSSDINVFGDFAVSTILFHETGHNLDWWVAGQGAGPYSSMYYSFDKVFLHAQRLISNSNV